MLRGGGYIDEKYFLTNNIMARLTKDQIIINIYYDLDEGFGSTQATHKKAKEEDPTITLEDVKSFLKKQPNKQTKNYRGTNSYTAPFARYEYQIDIMHMSPLAKDKNVPQYALVVIDIFSKLADVIPMEERDGEHVLKPLRASFKKMGYPMSVYSDDDGAFATKNQVQDFFNSEGIKHIITKTHANVAERFIRTMKNKIHDRARFNNMKWTDALTPALKQYNSTVHSSTRMTPTEAHKDDNEINVKVNLKLREKNKRKYPKIQENDTVKVFQKKRGNYTDRKEYVSCWSNNLFKVENIEYDIMGNKTYKLEGLTKPYLRHEVLLVA